MDWKEEAEKGVQALETGLGSGQQTACASQASTTLRFDERRPATGSSDGACQKGF